MTGRPENPDKPRTLAADRRDGRTSAGSGILAPLPWAGTTARRTAQERL